MVHSNEITGTATGGVENFIAAEGYNIHMIGKSRCATSYNRPTFDDPAFYYSVLTMINIMLSIQFRFPSILSDYHTGELLHIYIGDDRRRPGEKVGHVSIYRRIAILILAVIFIKSTGPGPII